MKTRLLVAVTPLFLICSLLWANTGAATAPETLVNHEDPEFARAIAAYDEGKLDQAKAILMQLLEQHPDDPKLLNNLAAVAVQKKAYAEAIDLLKRAIASNDDINTAYHNLSLIYTYQAALSYQKALALETGETSPPELNLINGKQTSMSELELSNEKLLAKEELNQPLVSKYEPVVEVPAKNTKEIISTVKQWAHVWSQQDLDGYFNSYLKNYHPPTEKSHERWKTLRAARLTTPQYIKIELEDIKVSITDGIAAQVTFIQRYQSNIVKSTVHKQLEMLKINQHWKIIDEKTLR